MNIILSCRPLVQWAAGLIVSKSLSTLFMIVTIVGLRTFALRPVAGLFGSYFHVDVSQVV